MTTPSDSAPTPDGQPREIGAAFAENPTALWIGLSAAVLYVAGDMTASAMSVDWRSHMRMVIDLSRGLGFLGICLLFGKLTNWDWDSLGLRPRAIMDMNFGYWIKATLVLGGIVLGACAVAAAGAALAVQFGWMKSFPEFTSMFHDSSDFWRILFPACIRAPLTEEAVYRFAICVPLVALVGRKWTIVASGLVFALLHSLYGHLAPTNAVAGFILAWAFLRSRSLAVPVVLHSLGNLCVALLNLALLY